MRFAFLQPELRLFGGTRRIVTMANLLVERGHEVEIFHPAGTPCQWTTCLARVRPLAESAAEEYDVALFNFPKQLDAALAARARLKIFYVLALYEKELLAGWRRVLLLRGKHARERELRACLTGPFHLLANATWIQRWLADAMGLECELLIGGVDHELFHPCPEVPPPASPRILTSGDPRSSKGARTVERAFAIVREQRPDVELETYHGKGLPQSAMAAVYAGATVFADAQEHGGWNNPVVEALACGTPVVATAIGAVEDFAIDGRTALLVPVGDAEAMAAAILRLLDDPALRRRLSESGLETVAKFRWDRSIERFLELVERRLAAAGAAR